MQWPFVPQLVAPWSTQMAFGSTEPVGTFVHVPSDPWRLHDLHEALQVVPQQTPCAQTPEVHSPAPEHGAPFAFVPHELTRHTLGLAQLAEVEQAPKHLAPLHA
jgi:hypothetical protein